MSEHRHVLPPAARLPLRAEAQPMRLALTAAPNLDRRGVFGEPVFRRRSHPEMRLNALLQPAALHRRQKVVGRILDARRALEVARLLALPGQEYAAILAVRERPQERKHHQPANHEARNLQPSQYQLRAMALHSRAE